MNVEYINPFVEASINIIRETTGIQPKLSKPYVKKAPSQPEEVLVLIGLTGKIQGNVVITFSFQVAFNIASAMMMGRQVMEFDEIAKSAIGELCNMILGNTATLFSKKGIEIDITPPTIFTGEKIELSVYKTVIVCIPLLFDDGSKMEIDISYIDN